MTSSLSLDLVRAVLARLPTISLLKFRSVCREWRDIIDDPHFVAMHTMSGVESPRILLLESESSCRAYPWSAVDDEFLSASLPDGDGASCHGLLCFENCGTTYLLNPLTREFISLPSAEPRRPHRIGIGLDCLTSRYKILRVNCSPYEKGTAYRPISAEVLDQGSWSWRDIASIPSSHLLGGPMFAAGSIHWSVAGRDRVIRISSFDVTKEEFVPTPCPELLDAHLVDLWGALGLVDCSCKERVDVWVMEEGGLWVKKYSIPIMPPPLWMPRCWLISRQGREFLGCIGRKIAVECSRRLLRYDPATNKLEHTGASPGGFGGSMTVSLLSPEKLWNADKAHHIRKK
ncbi:hypothetical protein BT93_J0306 [Corymbia citriodora subsp. variegata]|nr:hypothetical protein BT93_J0306 [Corymbia citriodora subsp. variegata]